MIKRHPPVADNGRGENYSLSGEPLTVSKCAARYICLEMLDSIKKNFLFVNRDGDIPVYFKWGII
jgi:hypothetical protein